ncbi:pheromone-like peptide [Pleurotus ostreatus PC15]|uniref:Pheromone-like peptide n=1 Tax=Pleurotus ostreatus (strain PC15) TaxID=1137138 RepID=A0A067N4G2_PLEO1|nr:pheromone-like peptide [Pleurotus ostreatus PC15]
MDFFATFLTSAPAPEITSSASNTTPQSTSPDVTDIELVEFERNGKGGGCYCIIS